MNLPRLSCHIFSRRPKSVNSFPLLSLRFAQVEAVLGSHPGVAEVAIVGVPDPQWGEIVCAVVVPRSGEKLTLASLRAHCEGRLASFKHPRRLVVAQAFPRTAATAQVQRLRLVEQILSGALRDGEAS